jgi:hypothetical protein
VDRPGPVRAARQPAAVGTAPVGVSAPGADGFRPDDDAVLVAVRHLLRESVADARGVLDALFDFLPSGSSEAMVGHARPVRRAPPGRAGPQPLVVPLPAVAAGPSPPIVPALALHPSVLEQTPDPLDTADPPGAVAVPTRALAWLVEHVDQPPALAAGCVELGPALQQLGMTQQRLDALGVLLADAMRANAGPGWRPEHEQAWRATTKLVSRWLGEGMARSAYEPPFWTGTVIWAEDAAVTVRTLLPYPCAPGQYTMMEMARNPRQWARCLVGDRSADNEVTLRVPGDPVVGSGERVRLRPT